MNFDVPMCEPAVAGISCPGLHRRYYILNVYYILYDPGIFLSALVEVRPLESPQTGCNLVLLKRSRMIVCDYLQRGEL